MQHSRTIKVGDLLTTPGTDDLLIWEHQPLETIDNLSSSGLNITMKLTSVNHGEAWITIIGLKASFDEICDYSGIKFVRELTIIEDDEEIIRFAIDTDDDEVYPLNSRDRTINLLDPITQLLKLYEPVSKIAPGHKLTNDDNIEESSEVSNIIFT